MQYDLHSVLAGAPLGRDPAVLPSYSWRNPYSQAQDVLQRLNMKHPSIKFKLALPDPNGYLPILNMKMKINEDGNLSLKHFKKPAN